MGEMEQMAKNMQAQMGEEGPLGPNPFAHMNGKK
jgi:hypothetical protein